MTEKLTHIKLKSDFFRKKLDKLKEIYNINTDTKLVEHILNLELQRF